MPTARNNATLFPDLGPEIDRAQYAVLQPLLDARRLTKQANGHWGRAIDADPVATKVHAIDPGILRRDEGVRNSHFSRPGVAFPLLEAGRLKGRHREQTLS